MRRPVWWAMVITTIVGFTVPWFVGETLTSPELVVIAFAMYAAVGAVVAYQRPENPIGWTFLAVGVLTAVAGLSGAGLESGLENGPPLSLYEIWSSWFQGWFWFPLFLLSTVFTFLFYPDGLPSRRWRPVMWLAIACTATVTLLAAFSPVIAVGDANAESPDPRAFTVDNPISPFSTSQFVFDDESWLFYGPMLVIGLCGLASVASAVVRTRRSSGVERQQMRLFVCAIVLIPLHIVISETFPAFGMSWVGDLTFALALAMIPLACGVAILRYRLYDIDRIIGRTTSYVLVSGVLLGVYALVVTSVGQLLPESSDLAVAAATLSAAALFRPVLGWARRVVARRFNREQYDAELVVEQFAQSLRSQTNPDDVGMNLRSVLDRTIQPRVSAVWLRRKGVAS